MSPAERANETSIVESFTSILASEEEAEPLTTQLPETLESLLQKYQAVIYGMAIRAIPDENRANKVVQQIVRRLAVEWPMRYQSVKPFTWMVTIVRRTIREALEVTADQPSLVNSNQSIKDDQAFLHKLIFEGHSQQELAQLTHTTLAEVRVRTRKVFQQFRQDWME